MKDHKMHALLILASAVLVALGRRVAGGAFQQWTGLNTGDYPARAFYALTALGAALAGGAAAAPHPLLLLLLVPAVFLGCSVPNFGGIAMGRSGDPWWRDALSMLCHGVLSLALAGAVLLIPGALPDGGSFPAGAVLVLGAGLLCPLLYEAGWCISGKSGRAGFPLGLRGGSEIGEALWGAAIGAALAAAC